MPKSNTPKPTEPHPFGNTTRSFSLLLCLGALAGVLIWAKLRLVTDIPRSAYADPREVETLEQRDDMGSVLTASDDEQEAESNQSGLVDAIQSEP